VDPRAGRNTGRAREQESTTASILVNRLAHAIPDRGRKLPLVDQDRRRDLGDVIEVRSDDLPLGWKIQRNQRLRTLHRRRGLADALGALQRDGCEVREQVIEQLVNDAATVGHLGRSSRWTPAN